MLKKYSVQIVAAKGDSPAEILVYGPIGKSFWSDEGISAEEFVNALNSIPKGQKVVIGINSQGGTIGEGLAMYAAIKRRSEDVTARIDGYALSAASFFPLAAGRVISPQTAIWMIHCGWSVVQGNARQLRKDAAMMDTHDKAMALAYTSKTGKKESEILSAMEEETWLTGKEAIAFGLADEESENPAALDALDFAATTEHTFKHIPAYCPHILSAAAKGDKPNTDAQAPSTSTPITAPAALEPVPAGPANTTKTKEPTMNKKEIVALLKARGVTVDDSSTEEQLLASLRQELEKPAASNGDNADIKAIKAQLEKERKARITLAIDKHILDNRMTRDEREDAVTRAMTDETYLDVIAKRPQVLPGASPLNGVAQFGDAGPRDVVMKLKKGRERYNFMRDNWSDLLASRYANPGRQLPQAANTTDAALVTDMLLEGATTILQNRLAPLRALSKEVSIDRIKPRATLQHRKITAGGTAQTNATSFEDTTNFVGTEENVPITVNQITSGGHITNAERQSGVTMAQWVDIKVAEISDKIMASVAAVILEATYTATPVVSAAAAFGTAELKTLWGQLKKSPIKNIILDGEYYARFLPDDLQEFNVLNVGIPGWDTFALNTVWTGATANTVGFACNPQAIVVGVGLPIRDPQANLVSSETTLALPDLGISVVVYQWYSNITRASWTTYDIMLGVAANDTTAGVLIKSA